MHTVAAVIDQGALTFDLAIPCEVFGFDRSDIVSPWYEFFVAAAGKTPVRTQTGFDLHTPYGLDDLARADTIIVPGWWEPEEPPSDALCGALRTADARGARIVSLCTGSFVLAAAGLLDGRRVTTHWAYADRLRARFPAIDVDPAPLYVSEGRIHTSAGTAAGIDLCLALVAADHGAEVAAAVARRLVMPLHRPGGQAQYVDRPLEPPTGELSALLDWAREHLGDGVRVDDLATRAALSTRQLTPPLRPPRRHLTGRVARPGAPSARPTAARADARAGRRDLPPRRLRLAGHPARPVRRAAEHLAARLPRNVLGYGSFSRSTGSRDLMSSRATSRSSERFTASAATQRPSCRYQMQNSESSNDPRTISSSHS